VTSTALADWRGSRADRLEELIRAHQRVGGTAAGRRTETQQINWALVLRLAAEFQGFVRDLHTIGADTFAMWAAPRNPQLEGVIGALLTLGLKLDVGNAEPASIGDAFNRFGINWWPALRNRDPLTSQRQSQLTRLNRARNAIAHARLHELESLRRDGYPLTLDTVRTWRSALNGLARTMDAVLAWHLGQFFSRPLPW